MNVYSPSQTALYDKCPTQWYLEHELNLVPRIATPKLIGGMFGSAAAKGLAIYHATREMMGQAAIEPQDIDRFVAIAKGEWSADYKHYESYGVQFPDFTPDTHLFNLENMIIKYIKSVAIPESWKIMSVEEPSPEAGNSRTDLVVKDSFDSFAVIDIKCKQKLEAKWYDKTVQDYAMDWAQIHYLWDQSRKKGIAIRRYYICLIVATPVFSAKLHPFSIDDSVITRFERTAPELWSRIDFDKRLELGQHAMATIHKDNFGRCGMWDACFVHNLDLDLIKTQYVQVPRRV